MQNNSPGLHTIKNAETAIFPYLFVLKKKVEKLVSKPLLYMNLSFKTKHPHPRMKSSTSPDEKKNESLSGKDFRALKQPG